MKKMVFPLLAILGLTLNIAACSGGNDGDKNTEVVATEDTPDVGTELPHAVKSSTAPKNGKVVKAMHAGGYTYMKVENDGNQFWIAATMLNVRRNDDVTWTDASLMKDFTSSALRKTFKEILFVSKVSVKTE
jgi:hypothetical protein